MLAALDARGVRRAAVTLHGGLGTSLPLRGDDPRAERLHAEWGEVTPDAAALINAAQAVEHYEICRYGTMVAWAKQLGKTQAATLFQATLDEEEATDKKLTQLAKGGINADAEMAEA